MNLEKECTTLLTSGDNDYHFITPELDVTTFVHQEMVPMCVQTLNDEDIPKASSSDVHQNCNLCSVNHSDTFEKTSIENVLTEGSLSTANETEIKLLIKNDYEQPFFKLPLDKKYHLFVAHSSEDSSEVNDLCNELEKRFFLKCMNYERDFIPGKLLEDNVYDEMKNSSKILIVISPSFLDSYWCITEARHAFQMAHTDGDNLKVIPILLRPVKKEIPSFLRSYRYIDVLQEKDVAAKIMDAFHHSAAVDQLCHKKKVYTEVEVKRQNGARLLSIEAVKLSPFHSYGYVYELEMISNKEKDTLNSLLDVDCEEQLTDVITRVNSHSLMRYYRVFNGWKFACSVEILLGIVATALTFGLYLLIIMVEKKIIENIVIMFLFALTFGGLVWIGSCGLLIILRRKLVTEIRRAIWKVNSNYFEENKCLIVFDITKTSKPSLTVVRYDTSACKEYVGILLEKMYRFTYNEVKIKEMAHIMITQRLALLQENGVLSNWTTLDSCDYNRHNTFLRKKCLCQLMEKEIIYQKEVITV